jgi:hypothetical protein
LHPLWHGRAVGAAIAGDAYVFNGAQCDAIETPGHARPARDLPTGAERRVPGRWIDARQPSAGGQNHTEPAHATRRAGAAHVDKSVLEIVIPNAKSSKTKKVKVD